MSKIIFTNTVNNIEKKFYPVSSINYLPEWYKNTVPYQTNNKSIDSSTIKKCIPVFDSITAGYLLLTPCDFYFQKVNNSEYIVHGGNRPDLGRFDIHDAGQAKMHPKNNNLFFYKWLNPWSIKTENGYSCLIMQPMHIDSPITILDGIVDTDTYMSPINLVFNIKTNFEGIMPAGTPIAQVLPFRREKYTMSIGNNLSMIKENQEKLLSKTYNRYRDIFWNRKEYK